MNGFISFDGSELIKKQSGTIKIPGVTNWLALYNCNIYLVTHATGKSVKDIPEHTQYLLLKKGDGSYTIMLPLICGDMKASLCSGDEGVVVKVQGALSGEEPESTELLYIADGRDPHKLSEDTVREVSKRLGSCKQSLHEQL